jgi:uncharacterized protein (TIGR03790 family)
MDQIVQLTVDGEKHATTIDPSFKPASTEQTVEALALRIQRAMGVMEAEMNRATDPARRQELEKYLQVAVVKLTGPVPGEEIMPQGVPATAPAMPVAELGERPYDPVSREQLRREARKAAGAFPFLKILQSQIDYLTAAESGAAFDSELALLWWPTYGRSRWQPNFLNPHFKSPRPPPTLMVMRLDGTSPQMVRDIIATSIRVEREGLQGKLVVDSRGLKPVNEQGTPDSFGVFDQRLRTLANLVRTKTDVSVVHDEKPEVLPPNSVDDVALYCGWYSVQTYVPGMKFNAGALGFHVASFELITLRDPARPGWVKGLLENGVVGSVGPVAEPYLHSFPAPDEFFPLLLTGTKTLSEVYWTTTPLTSWMQTCIGDPLYNPYQKHPRMKVQDLPAILREPAPIQAPPADDR